MVGYFKQLPPSDNPAHCCLLEWWLEAQPRYHSLGRILAKPFLISPSPPVLKARASQRQEGLNTKRKRRLSGPPSCGASRYLLLYVTGVALELALKLSPPTAAGSQHHGYRRGLVTREGGRLPK